MFSQPVRQPGNTHAAQQKRIELGCPEHSVGKWTEQERWEETRAQRKEGKVCTSLSLQSSEVNFLIVSWKAFTKQPHWTEVLEPGGLNYSKIYRKGAAGCECAKHMKDGRANFRCCSCKVFASAYICPSEDSGLFSSSLNRKTRHWFFHYREYVQSPSSAQMDSRSHF